MGEKRPNGWGLYDMQGNMWEQCTNWHMPDFGIACGECWQSRAAACPAWYRQDYWVNKQISSVGFRVVCVIGATAPEHK